MERDERGWREIPDDVHLNETGRPDGQWIFGRGGFPLGDDEWSLSFYPQELNAKEIRYKLPPWMNHMMDSQFRHGEDTARSKIKHALGL